MINSGFKPWIYWYSSPGVKSGEVGIKAGSYRFLSDSQVKDLDYAAKEILRRTGVKIPNEICLGLLEKAGATVDFKEQRVRIPASLVDEAIKNTPKSFMFGGRDAKKAIKIDTEHSYFVHGIGPYMIATDGSVRNSTARDMQDAYRVLEACENVDVAGIPVGGTASTPEDEMHLPLTVRRLRKYLMMLDFMEKPVDTSRTYVIDKEDEAGDIRQAALDQIQMEIAVRGSLEELQKTPMSLGFNEAVSPLMYLPRNLEKLLVYAEHGLPMFIGSGPMTNATGPATMAGTLSLWLAETLTGLVLGYLAGNPDYRPPALWMCFTGLFDQLTAHGPIMGAPEGVIVQSACADIAHFYGFSIRGCIGSPSKALDPQAGYETGVGLLTSVMAGVNYHVSIGTVGPGEVGVSLEKIVLDNELAGYIKRIMRGIEVTEETLAVDVIDEVGPGGTFLIHPHTRKWFRKEQYFPSLFDRRKYEDWVRRGKKNAVQRAEERVQEILRDYWPEPLDKGIRKRIEDHVKMIEKRMAKS
ncbi:MAG: trimethylamine methyltransferase family protein [Candidatus Bathyarchaeota archaeon]|nr:trimethylamine methyltransferase family protein [Candidatus Bathyarchaeota archaeon]